MSNIIYQDIMYNPDTKESFLSQHESDYQDNFRRLFKIAYPIESQLRKDICEFTRDELRGYFFRTMPKTIKASKTNVSHISNYIDWAIDHKFRKNNINPLSQTDLEWKTQFSQKKLKSYWTEPEIRKIIESRTNYQDAILVMLPFYGVYGRAASEILNLSIKQVSIERNELTLTNDKKESRVISVPEELINMCVKANKELDYEKMNGHTEAKAPTLQLIDNDYIIKLARTRNKSNMNYKADHNILHRRTGKISDEIEEPNFTTKNIVYSGMIYFAKQLYEQTGKLEKEEYELIAKQFNADDAGMYRYKTDFLNLDTIKEIYKLT